MVTRVPPNRLAAAGLLEHLDEFLFLDGVLVQGAARRQRTVSKSSGD